MNVAIYIRVSREDLHTENQLIQLNEYVKEKNYTVTETYEDHISGKTESRPALDRLLKDVKEKKFEAVLIWKLDRLGRSLQHLIRVVNYFHKNNVDLICQTQNIDTTTSGGKLLFHIFCAIAEFERDLISERTKAGLVRARAQGKVIGRKMGQKDKKKRKTGGYIRRYEQKEILA